MRIARLMSAAELKAFKKGELIRPLKNRPEWSQSFPYSKVGPTMCFMDWSNSTLTRVTWPIATVATEATDYLVVFETRTRMQHVKVDYPRSIDMWYGEWCGYEYPYEIHLDSYSRSQMRVELVVPLKRDGGKSSPDAARQAMAEASRCLYGKQACPTKAAASRIYRNYHFAGEGER